MILSEKIVHTNKYAGCIDILTGIENFDTPDLTYEEEWHVYKLNGVIIPSVTQLLDTGEYINVPEVVLEYARKKGTLVHKEIEEYLKEGKIGFTQELDEFIKLYKKNNNLFNQVAIFDIKTYSSNSKDKIEKCYKQLCMYGKAVEYLTGIKVEHHYEIWLPHNKKGKIIDLDEYMKGMMTYQ